LAFPKEGVVGRGVKISGESRPSRPDLVRNWFRGRKIGHGTSPAGDSKQGWGYTTEEQRVREELGHELDCTNDKKLLIGGKGPSVSTDYRPELRDR